MLKSDPSLGRICQINTNYWFNQLDTTETGYSVKLDLKQRISTSYWFNQLDTTKTKQLRLGKVWN